MTSRTLPVFALTLNALVWGTSWWPFRWLQAHGLHPLWATALVYAVAVAVIVAARPRAVPQLLRTPALWVLMLAAGTTNAAYNWGVVIGDVVRVALLFYLMPLWAALLARWILREPLTLLAAARVMLGLVGAGVVLWPAGDAAAVPAGGIGLPLPRTLAEWLGVLGGASFALNNVMLRRDAHRPEEGRALAMFLGGAVVAGALAAVLAAAGTLEVPSAPVPGVWLAALGLAALFLLGNLALQYGAGRLPAHVTSVVMLTEVLFASGSALALGAGTLNTHLWFGGGLIVLAALLSVFEPAAH